MTFSYVRWGKLLLGISFLLCLSMVFLVSQFTLTDSKVRLVQGSLIQRNLDRLPGGFGADLNHWLSKNILRLEWEGIHCRRIQSNLSNSVMMSKWIKSLSRQLDIKDGQSLFDTNTGCLEWLRYFRSDFPNLSITGYDEDDDAVDFAERYFNRLNDTSGSFIKKLSQARNSSFDHAINIAGLQTMRADRQCSKVRAILRTIKPGGSLYLGNNLERNCQSLSCDKCFSDMEKVGFTVLDKCFWPRICLDDHPEIMDVYYIPEQEFYSSMFYFDACQTGVFIRKKVANSTLKLTGRWNTTLPPAPKYSNVYRC